MKEMTNIPIEDEDFGINLCLIYAMDDDKFDKK